MINEDAIIQTLQDYSHGFIGDDASVLPHIGNGKYVISKDLLIEEVHFRIKYFTPQDLAHKALHVNLSDIAAMGSQPLYILCGISVPPHLQEYAKNVLNHLTTSCQKAGVILIGGDTTASTKHLFISITAIGLAPDGHITLRSTATNDDFIGIVGNLGFAHLGFIALEHSLVTKKQYISSFLRPEAKIKEGLWLRKQACVTSMMDISDGLYIDLKRLCKASKKSAVIDIDLLQAILGPEISLDLALEGGEDYGLLLTIKKNSFESLSNEFMRIFGDTLKIIGHITDGDDISFTQENQTVDLFITPFTHFGEK